MCSSEERNTYRFGINEFSQKPLILSHDHMQRNWFLVYLLSNLTEITVGFLKLMITSHQFNVVSAKEDGGPGPIKHQLHPIEPQWYQ